MTFYHIRYNIYPLQGAPVEKEEWLTFPAKHNEQQLKRLLIDKNGAKVSIILHQVIGEEQYRNMVADASRLLKEQAQIDKHNLDEWSLAASSQMLNWLNDEAAENDDRYRNVDKPPPLL
jgi:hypothetical protein